MSNFVITHLDFSTIFHSFFMFINFHEYELIYISYHKVKVLCLEIKFDNKFSVVDLVAAEI